ncbi:MAG: FAD:protein FMN transferase [Elusimicrobiota bacterium]
MSAVFFTALLKLCLNSGVLPAGGPGAPSLTRARYLMGTVCEITAHGPGAAAGLEATFSEIERVESILSTFRDQSELSRLNREGSHGAVRVSTTLWDALSHAVRSARASSGAFDPTFDSPPAARGFTRIHLRPRTRSVLLDPGTIVRLDAFGKGYALDRAAALLRANGVSSALLNFGGQVLALGAPPGRSAWPVDLAPPDCPPRLDPHPAPARCARPALTLFLKDASLSTSGSSEQGDHILNPSTGERMRRSSTLAVASQSAADADAWSTALFVRGLSNLPKAFPGCALELIPPKEGSPTAPAPVFAGQCASLTRGRRVSFLSHEGAMKKETHP